MEFENIKLTDIVPAEYNPRKISNDDFNKLSNSINEFGLVDPIIVNLKNNHIIGGHQRYDVLMDEHIADSSKYEDLKLIRLGDIGWVFPEDSLTVEDEAHEKALNVALNKISGEWDNEKLQELFTDLNMSGFDLNLTGFDEVEVTQLEFEDDIQFFDDISEDLGEDDFDEEEDKSDNKITDEEGYVVCPDCGHRFQPEYVD